MTGPNEPPRIANGGEHPDSWDHRRIYDAFNPLDTTEANNGVSEYAQIAQRWTSAAELFAARIRHSSEAAWDGPAARESREKIGNYAQRALDFSGPLNLLSQRVSSAIDGVDKTRTSVDEPPDGASWFNPRGWHLGPMHGPSSQSVRNDCENAAREAMKNHYVTNFVQADQQIPVLPPPDSPTNPLYTPPAPGGDDQQPAPADTGGAGPSPGGAGPAGANQPAEAPKPGDQPTDNPQQQSGPSDTTPASSDPSQTSPASASGDQPSATNPSSPASTTPSGYSGGSGGSGSGGGGLGGGGLGGGGVAGGGAAAGGPGRSVPGGQPAAGGAAPAGGAGAGGRGSAGMPGMGGLGGARGKSEDDEKTHDLPDWLRNAENAEELIGPAPKTLPGGVIGGENDGPPPTSTDR